MAKPSSQIVATWVAEDIALTEWTLLREVCVSTVLSRWTGKSDLEIEDFVEENIDHVAECLRNISAECIVDGRIQVFEIDNEPQAYIRSTGASYGPILDAIRSIDPFKVERLCSEILSRLGAESFSTPPSHDGGIDFIATNITSVPDSFPFPNFCKTVVIGQTKRYKKGNIISETQIREFVGAGVLRRHELQVQGKIGPFTPVLLAFWTTSDFEPSAKRFARNIGLWFMDGITLASYISRLGLTDTMSSNELEDR